MKMMFDLMAECANKLKEYLEKPARNGEMLEMKEVMAKFTTDVIGICAFGLQSNAFNDSDSEFRQMGRQVFRSSPIKGVINILQLIFPSLMGIFPIKTLPDLVSNFFIRTVKEVMDYREKNNVSRNDFLQLLIELKNKGRVHDDELEKLEEKLDGISRKESEINVGEYIVLYFRIDCNSFKKTFLKVDVLLSLTTCVSI
jgi:cytochrome P450 family 6